ncbi:hypothetical protein COO60DRAFT_1530969 [Scenedesmus sp. NREL 46B-D3]|nr:hypothetical protein COO60DRAFT_1530969 [Scenedesmus sp. NREL 46B-D3]
MVCVWYGGDSHHSACIYARLLSVKPETGGPALQELYGLWLVMLLVPIEFYTACCESDGSACRATCHVSRTEAFSGAPSQQQHLQQQRQQELDELVQTKKKAAVADFWELLVDFIVIKAAPLTWLDIVPADHPFLRVVDGRLQLAPRRDSAP